MIVGSDYNKVREVMFRRKLIPAGYEIREYFDLAVEISIESGKTLSNSRL